MSSSEMKNMSCQRLNEVLIATNGKHVCIYIYIWDGVSSLEWQPALRWCLKKIIWTTMCLSWISRRVSSVVKPYLKSFWQDSLSGMIQLALCVINPCPGSLKNTPMYVVMHVCNWHNLTVNYSCNKISTQIISSERCLIPCGCSISVFGIDKISCIHVISTTMFCSHGWEVRTFFLSNSMSHNEHYC